MTDRMEFTSEEGNPDDLEEGIDIDLPTQRKILGLVARLESVDHYTLLGVDPSSEKKDIKRAYFDRMNEFHLDKFYGKKIGSFGPRLQKITQQLTKASDTLSRNKTRAEYDAYLASRNQTLGARDSIPPHVRSSIPPAEHRSRPSRPAVAPIDFVQNIPRAPKTPQIEGTAPSPSGAGAVSRQPEFAPKNSPEARSPVPGARQGAPPQAAAHHSASSPDANERPSPEPPASPRPASHEAARRLLARKMGRPMRPAPGSGPRGGGPPQGEGQPSTPKATTVEGRRALDADLKARFDARRNQGQQLAAKYRLIAEEARAKGDWGAAVGAIRNAAQAMPDDPALQVEATEYQNEADRALAPRFLEQGKYEEKEGSYDRAARSYERAARGKNSAELFDRAAKCLLKLGHLSDDDKRKLVDLARKSVSLDNRHVDYRLTLAKAYDVTGMRTSAQGEVRRALELDPSNKDAKELQKAFR